MSYLKYKTVAYWAVILSLSFFAPWNLALAQGGRYSDWHMGPGMMGSWGGSWFGGIIMMFFCFIQLKQQVDLLISLHPFF